VVEEPSSVVDGQPVFSGIERYTRRGDFQPDKNGYLVNGAGYFLQGIPVDPTTGNLIGSVPQVLRFQNDFLPAQATSQIEYRANLASYPLTPTADANIPRSELLNPISFSANPVAGAPVAATITGTGAALADVIASVSGTGTFAVPATTQLGVGNGGTLRITVTPSGGAATNYDLVFADTDALDDIIADINGTAGLNAAVTASIDTSGGTNKLRIVADSADFSFDISTFSTDALTTRLGLAEVAHPSSNLMSKGQVTSP
jgi:flagellar hook protein FlgE